MIARDTERDQQLSSVATQAREATERAELAEEAVAGLRNEVASTNAVLIERTAELEAVKRGSITVKQLERVEAIVAENAGPENAARVSVRRKRRSRKQQQHDDHKHTPPPTYRPPRPDVGHEPYKQPSGDPQPRPNPSRTEPPPDTREGA